MSYFVGCNAVDEGIPEDAGLMGLETKEPRIPSLTNSAQQGSPNLVRLYEAILLGSCRESTKLRKT